MWPSAQPIFRACYRGPENGPHRHAFASDSAPFLVWLQTDPAY
jgi:hypothetical protein